MIPRVIFVAPIGHPVLSHRIQFELAPSQLSCLQKKNKQWPCSNKPEHLNVQVKYLDCTSLLYSSS